MTSDCSLETLQEYFSNFKPNQSSKWTTECLSKPITREQKYWNCLTRGANDGPNHSGEEYCTRQCCSSVKHIQF